MGSRHVRFYPPTPRDKLINEYTGASVAWDVMARNPERELAFTSRTVEYLGLPVVYNNYAEQTTSQNMTQVGSSICWMRLKPPSCTRDPEQSSASTP